MKIEIKKSIKPVDYFKAIDFLEKRLVKIDKKKGRELIWILKHPHIYTAGTNYKDSELLDKSIKLAKTNRGGKITYHGPGQRIIYFMINLNKRKKDVRTFITIIEKSLIDLLESYNIQSTTFKDRVGIWVTGKNGSKFTKEEKIGAIGLRLKNWITYHGLSFNINPNMNNYNYINACGLENYKNISLNELGIKIREEEFDFKYLSFFKKHLNILK